MKKIIGQIIITLILIIIIYISLINKIYYIIPVAIGILIYSLIRINIKKTKKVNTGTNEEIEELKKVIKELE